MGTLHEDLYTFMIISHSILLRMRNVSDKRLRESQNTHFMFNNFFSENCATYEIMWKNMVQPYRPATDDKMIWLMPFACWVTKASDTLSICGTYCCLSARMVLQRTISVIHDNT